MSSDLGAIVRGKLFEKNMTQGQLAKLVGIGDVYLSDILHGRKTGPKPQEHIKKIKKILDIK
ncbi:helix-turn-helix transcriptional regulator [Loigolactobacillus coryniformis]|uniref:Helix-turn-helix domain-containing protein n=2 Tax=Loigolactobacillus jiayinensis TaxID=2486016 RepID=A0ABW1RFE3_9LACO|nr:helix-turn-helix transcriptional regulator [Loigolactobacillus jiayinensis]MDC4184527.1 helix-turn-helix transcriptional regulator [Loigolactobacillus coryniformis]